MSEFGQLYAVRMSTEQAADYLGLSAKTLEAFRYKGGGPRFAKLGKRRVVYDRRDLDDWFESRKRTSTADHGVRAAA